MRTRRLRPGHVQPGNGHSGAPAGYRRLPLTNRALMLLVCDGDEGEAEERLAKARERAQPMRTLIDRCFEGITEDIELAKAARRPERDPEVYLLPNIGTDWRQGA